MPNRELDLGVDVAPRHETAPSRCTGTPAAGDLLRSKRQPPVHVRLEFDDGSAVVVQGVGLIGRDPVPRIGGAIEHLISLADDTCSLSRTHLQFGVSASGLWVRDYWSTNGSEIECEGRLRRIEPGVPVAAPNGCSLHLGARRVTVRTVATGVTSVSAAIVGWGAAPRAGSGHERNQDAYCAELPVFVVADGMGGDGGGDLASRAAVDALASLGGRQWVTSEMLRAPLAHARAKIGWIDVAGGRPPGTTLSGVIITHVEAVPS
jgi:hypothetical protein